MRDFFTAWIEFHYHMISDGILMSMCCIFLALCELLMLLLILYGIFYAIDSWFLPLNNGTGRVVGKNFTPAHTDMVMQYNPALKTSAPTYIHHPDRYTLIIKYGNLTDSIFVNEGFFDEIDRGQQVKIKYITGRFSGGLYIKQVW